jgi:hypothetical protein
VQNIRVNCSQLTFHFSLSLLNMVAKVEQKVE